MTGIGSAATPPKWLEGAWRRVGRALGTDRLEETSRVWWLQVAGYFADLRIPNGRPEGHLSYLDAAQAFSGLVSYEDPTLTWRHDLDTFGRPLGYRDRAEVERSGDELIERGPDYVEVWRRQGAPGPLAVLERRDPRTDAVNARIMVVGDRALIVWGGLRSGGAMLHVEDEGWDVEGQIGAGSIPWTAVLSARSGRAIEGWRQVA